MGKKPIYRLHSIASRGKEEINQHLLASIDIPDALPPGSVIHLQFPLVSVNGEAPHPNLTGGGFIRIKDDGRMEFDGT